MIYKKLNEEEKLENTTPVKIIPLADDFKEELYNMYKVYKPEADQND